MGEELIIKDMGTLVTLTGEQGLDQVIKPLVKEIYLFDTYIAGTSHLKDPSVMETIKEGDKLTLKREDNKFDEKAILVLNDKGQKLGYVPERDNVIFSRLMDAGKLLIARVDEMEKFGNYYQVQIRIFLIDF